MADDRDCACGLPPMTENCLRRERTGALSFGSPPLPLDDPEASSHLMCFDRSRTGLSRVVSAASDDHIARPSIQCRGMNASDEALPPTSSCAVVLTTVKSPEDARQIAEKLLSERLAACVQMLPIDSLYTWKGEVAADREVLLLVKTRKELYPELEKAIVSVHKYETPEILLLPVASGLPAYLSWMEEVT